MAFNCALFAQQLVAGAANVLNNKHHALQSTGSFSLCTPPLVGLDTINHLADEIAAFVSTIHLLAHKALFMLAKLVYQAPSVEHSSHLASRQVTKIKQMMR